MKKRELLAVITGGIVEWFDYLLYAFFAPVFASQFFPSADKGTALLLSFLIFSGGFLVRPIGGAMIGYVADHLGRRKALLLTISLMTFSTLGMAFLPTYATIGILSPIFLTIIRLSQGLAVSGELNTAASYLAEQAPKNKKCFYTSFTSASASFGVCLGALVAYLAHNYLSSSDLYAWGWRLPFLLAALLGLFSGALRYFSDESDEYKTLSKKVKNTVTVKSLFSKYKLPMVQMILLSATLGVGNYYLFVFINNYLSNTAGLDETIILLINFLAIMTSVCLIPVCGYFADRIGTITMLKFGLTGFALSIVPSFILLSQLSVTMVIIGELIYIVFLSIIAATIPHTMVKAFPIEIRTTAGALSYNASQAIFGGTAPALALWMTHSIRFSLAPALYLMVVALISLSVAYWISVR